MSNNIQVFESTEFGTLEVLMINDKPYFPATECAKVLGYKNPQKAVRDHCQGVNDSFTPSAGGVQKKNYIPEGDLYRLIIRSKLPAAIRFEEWVCDKVLPSIRKHGAYITDELLEKLRHSEELSKYLIERLTDEREKAYTLATFADTAIPKVRYHDIVLQCPDAVQASIIAKDYGMSCVAFNKLLHRLRVQFKIGKTWLLYKNHEGNAYTITNTYTKNGMTTLVHTCWTQRGRYWLYELLKSHGILPIAEKMSIFQQMSLDDANSYAVAGS